MARSTLVRTFVFGVGLALTVAQGCANQAEGERCEPNAARDADCDDGLVCVPNDQLLDQVEGADDFGRCCPPTGESFSDERCTRVGSTGIGGSGGTAGTGGTSVEAGAAGMSEMGGAPAGGGAGATSGAGGDVSAAGASGSGTAGVAAIAGAGGQSGAPSTAGGGGI